MQNIEIPTLNQVIKTDDKEIAQFVRLVNEGIEAWNKAGKLFVTMMARDERTYQKIRQKHPEMSVDMLRVFERIGRKQIYAPLLAHNSIAARRLLDCPYEMQEQYCNGRIDVVTEVRNGVPKTVAKRLDELNRIEVKQVFGEGCIHNIDQQIFRLKETKKAKPMPMLPSSPGQKPVEVGYYTVSVDSEGKVTLAPAAKSDRAQWVRVVPNGSGYKTALCLFYRTVA